MTRTDPTAAALLRAILLRPADDAARLVFADWLDEHARAGACPQCTREGIPAVRQAALRAGCRYCRGAGTVSDGCAERAEFIRVQVELARKRDSEPPPAPTRELAEFVRDLVRLENRERELLTDARRGEWSGIPCPVCEGKGWIVGPPGGRACRLCGDNTTNNGTGFAPVEFRRGFPERVRCRMGDVLRWSNSEAWTLTPWARAALAAHPVTAWEIAGAEPWANYAGTHWGWWSDNLHTVADASTLPHVVMSAIAEDSRRRDSNISLRYTAAKAVPNGCVLFATDAEARDALALAVGRVARRLAGLPEVTP